MSLCVQSLKIDIEDFSVEALYELLMLLPQHHNPISPGKERSGERGGGGRGYRQMEWRRRGGEESIENITFCRGKKKILHTSIYII